MSDDWKAAWQPLIDRVGQDIGPPGIVWGADAVEAGTVRRFIEPLEFDCPLHYDRAIARAHGHADIIAPCTSLTTFTIPPIWVPGKTVFDSPGRDAQPVSISQRNQLPPEAPPYTSYFGTDVEIDFLRPVVVGERLGRRGQLLLRCQPKETKVGRGAFVTWETEIVTTDGEVVARQRMGMFYYSPRPKADAAGEGRA